MIFAGAAGDLLLQPIFTQIAARRCRRELLQVLQDLLDAPAAADIVADDRVEYVAAVLPVRRAVTDDLLDLIDAVAGSRCR